jgi:hypothetical protein
MSLSQAACPTFEELFTVPSNYERIEVKTGQMSFEEDEIVIVALMPDFPSSPPPSDGTECLKILKETPVAFSFRSLGDPPERVRRWRKDDILNIEGTIQYFRLKKVDDFGRVESTVRQKPRAGLVPSRSSIYAVVPDGNPNTEEPPDTGADQPRGCVGCTIAGGAKRRNRKCSKRGYVKRNRSRRRKTLKKRFSRRSRRVRRP